MPEKENATSGKLVAGNGLSTNGSNSAQVHYTTNLPTGIEGDLQALLADAKVEPADVLTVAKVQQQVDLVATYQGMARLVALSALTLLVGHLQLEERQRLKLGGLFQREAEVATFLAQCPPPPGARKFRRMSLAELRAMPPKMWLIDQIIGAGDLGMLYGPPGSAKTFLILDLVFSACLARRWAMRFDVARPLTVAYCAGEGASGLPQRVNAAGEFYGTDDLPNFHFYNAAPQLFTADAGEFTEASIVDFVREWQEDQAAGVVGQLDLLIVDTLHSASGGADENSVKDMGHVLRGVKAATSALGCAVLLVHHTNKAGTGERGSSALRGAMDVMISTSPSNSKFALTCEKLKDGEAWKPQTFDLLAVGDTESVRIWWDEVQSAESKSSKQTESTEALVAVLKGANGTRFTATSLAEAIGIGGSKQIFRLLPLAMKAEPGIKCGLKYPDRDASPYNPMLYHFADGASKDQGSSEDLVVT